MPTYAVGQLYHPSRTKWDEGTIYVWRGDATQGMHREETSVKMRCGHITTLFYEAGEEEQRKAQERTLKRRLCARCKKTPQALALRLWAEKLDLSVCSSVWPSQLSPAIAVRNNFLTTVHDAALSVPLGTGLARYVTERVLYAHSTGNEPYNAVRAAINSAAVEFLQLHPEARYWTANTLNQIYEHFKLTVYGVVDAALAQVYGIPLDMWTGNTLTNVEGVFRDVEFSTTDVLCNDAAESPVAVQCAYVAGKVSVLESPWLTFELEQEPGGLWRSYVTNERDWGGADNEKHPAQAVIIAALELLKCRSTVRKVGY